MQIRAIKTKSGSNADLKELSKRLDFKIKRAGFLTTVTVVNTSRIDIKGGHSGVSNVYATVNIQKRGYNYRVNSFTVGYTKLGFKRTNVLTWDQRVELNNLINDVLDKACVSATIQSRGFKVRDKQTGRVNRWEVQYESALGDSFQPNFHDWIYSDEAEAQRAVAFVKEYERGSNAPAPKLRPSLTLLAGGRICKPNKKDSQLSPQAAVPDKALMAIRSITS